jgi:hypothetical protein
MVLTLLICSLFNYDISNLGFTALSDWMMVNIELGRMWKEVVTASFKVLPWHLPRETE